MHAALLLGLLASTVAPSAQPSVPLRGDAELQATWSGEPRWLEGAGFGRGTFDGGVIFAQDMPFGSTVPQEDVPLIRLDLDPALTTTTRVYRVDDGFPDAGTGLFNGAAYDLSDPDNPRRLNVVAAEDARYRLPDNQWGPGPTNRGDREYLLVMASDYDESGATYAEANPFQDEQDAYYFVALQQRFGFELFEAPASLTVAPIRIGDLAASRPENGTIALSWSYDPAPGITALHLYAAAASPADRLVQTLDPDAQSTAFTTTEQGPFYFRLEAVDAAGTPRSFSREISAQPIVSQGASLIGHLSPAEAGAYADLWGYTDPATGREYALLVDIVDGLHVIDVTDPEPVLLASVGRSDPFAASLDVKTFGRYAYLAYEFAPIAVIDLADPANPQVVGTIDTQPGATDGGTHNVVIEGQYLYAVGGRDPGGLRVYDLGADPIAPPLVSAYQPAYFHDLHFNGDVAYALAIEDELIYVLDASDPSALTFRTLATYPSAGPHNACSTEDGAYLYVGDEVGASPWTHTFDVRDLDNIERVGQIIVNDEATVHNCYVAGDFLFVAHYTEGLQVFDVGENPAAPERIAFYDTFDAPSTGLVGAWSVYPYFASGKVIVSDTETGLYVIDVDAVTASPAEAPPPDPTLLMRAYPNPIVGQAVLAYAVPEAGPFRLALYDVLGRELALLADGDAPAGRREARLDARALGLAPGVYVARLETEAGTASTSVTIAR